MGKFKIGDKVIVTEHNGNITLPYISLNKDIFNLVGTICGVHCSCWLDGSISYGIEFEENIGGHNCDGSCKDGYGQNINSR